MTRNVADSAPTTVPAERVGTGVLAATCVSAFVVIANTSAVTILLPAIRPGPVRPVERAAAAAGVMHTVATPASTAAAPTP